MHTLWSRTSNRLRAACRCYTCLAPAGSAAARSHAPRRIQPHGFTTTLFYSSVITVAAAADVHFKIQRTQELDAAIAAVESDLAETHSSDPEAPQAELSPVETILKPLLFREFANVAPNSTYVDFTVMPEDRAAREKFLDTATRWLPQKCLRVEYCVAWLTSKWQYTVAKHNLQLDPDSAHLKEQLHRWDLRRQEMFDKFTDVTTAVGASDETPFPRPVEPQYYRCNNSNARRTVRGLNQTISKLADLHASGRVKLADTISLLSEFLLRSPSPPNIDTFSLLIKHFLSMNLLEFAEMTQRALSMSMIRPNEAASAVVLDSLMRQNNKEGFRQYCNHMDLEGDGLMLAASWVRPSPLAPARIRRRIKRVGEKTFQSVEFDAALYESRILGELHFGLLGRARKTLNQMLDDGLRPTVKILSAILFHFANQDNWYRVQTTWRAIKTLWISPALDFMDPRSELWAYQAMLYACKHSERTAEHGTIFAEAQAKGIPRHLLENKPLFYQGSCVAQRSRIAHMERIAWLAQRHEREIHDTRRGLAQIEVHLRGVQTVFGSLPVDAEAAALRELAESLTNGSIHTGDMPPGAWTIAEEVLEGPDGATAGAEGAKALTGLELDRRAAQLLEVQPETWAAAQEALDDAPAEPSIPRTRTTSISPKTKASTPQAAHPNPTAPSTAKTLNTQPDHSPQPHHLFGSAHSSYAHPPLASTQPPSRPWRHALPRYPMARPEREQLVLR